VGRACVGWAARAMLWPKSEHVAGRAPRRAWPATLRPTGETAPASLSVLYSDVLSSLLLCPHAGASAVLQLESMIGSGLSPLVLV
jgi:hypothetical protein